MSGESWITKDRRTDWTHIVQVISCLECGDGKYVETGRVRKSQAEFLNHHIPVVCPVCGSGWIKTQGDESTLEFPT